MGLVEIGNQANMTGDNLITAPQVMARVLGKHPEIIQVSMAVYSPYPHGTETGDFYNEFIPISVELPDLAQGRRRRVLPEGDEVAAVGSIVTYCSEGECDHSPESHNESQLRLWYLWHEDNVTGLLSFEVSLLFLDFETYQPGILEKIGEA